jgi:hypothetical protein
LWEIGRNKGEFLRRKTEEKLKQNKEKEKEKEGGQK